MPRPRQTNRQEYQVSDVPSTEMFLDLIPFWGFSVSIDSMSVK